MRQLIRYGFVGVASNAIIFTFYLALTAFGVDPKVAMTLVYITGASIGYFCNARWTFMHSGEMFGTAIRYGLAQFVGYLLNLLILFLFADHLGYAHQWVQFGAIVVVAGFLFILFKYMVFRKNITH